MQWRIEISNREGVFDSHGQGIQKDINDLGLPHIKKVEVVHVYNVQGSIDQKQVELIAQQLLTNHVTQRYQCFSYNNYHEPNHANNCSVIEIAHNTGVMDPVEESTIKGINDLGFLDIDSVRTAKKYLLQGRITDGQRKNIVNKVLSNKLIQHVVEHKKGKEMLTIDAQTQNVSVVEVDLIDSSKAQLKKLSEDGQLFLNVDEMLAIQKHFKKLKRNPTDCELETIAQTWSEHCYHKTFRGNIKYTSKENGKTKTKIVRNLLKSTIAKATYELDKKWCLSVFHDNAGVIEFDEKDAVCFKVETHNHPSALEPFGGANTGIGGVIRDTLGTGLGAKPIANTDIFCFAPPETAAKDVPEGSLHPKRVMKGVVSGVRDYGNKMGIPTVNGAIIFDEHYVGNPLVYCGNVGLIPKNKVFKKSHPGDYIVAVGGKTGRDGIHGATFSSGELTSESEVVSSGAVQIGDPIQEKKVADALLQARDKNLYSALTDCGAGGFSSAVGEMGQELGAKVQLKDVPLKYQGLTYEEIWISESQERMVLSVPPKKLKVTLELFASENVDATVIGEFTNTKRLEIFFDDIKVCDLSMEFLHEGNPKITKTAIWNAPKLKNENIHEKKDLTGSLLSCLSHYNVCSKEWVIRQYDHEVQGGSVIKPLVGINCDGPSDASVISPILGKKKGVAISNGINAQFGKIDPYWMAVSCIDEAVRQVVAVGGNPSRIAILDNFCWGNPDKPDRLGGLVRCAEGCYKAAKDYSVPFISGKDSLYNEYTQGKDSIAIPGTILISAIGIVDDVHQTITMDFKEADNLIYCVGNTYDELGGSIYFDTLGQLGADVPQTKAKTAMKIFNAMHKAIVNGYIRSAHDCSEGGLAVAVAEMSFAGGLGASINLNKVPKDKSVSRNDTCLFSESNSRFIVEVLPENKSKFEKALKGLPFGLIGNTNASVDFEVTGLNKKPVITTDIHALKEAWQKPLRW